MILRDSNGQLIKREDDPVTREMIVNKQTQLTEELARVEAKLNKLQSLKQMVDTDLAEYDRLTAESQPVEAPAPTPEALVTETPTEQPPTA